MLLPWPLSGWNCDDSVCQPWPPQTYRTEKPCVAMKPPPFLQQTLWTLALFGDSVQVAQWNHRRCRSWGPETLRAAYSLTDVHLHFPPVPIKNSMITQWPHCCFTSDLQNDAVTIGLDPHTQSTHTTCYCFPTQNSTSSKNDDFSQPSLNACVASSTTNNPFHPFFVYTKSHGDIPPREAVFRNDNRASFWAFATWKIVSQQFQTQKLPFYIDVFPLSLFCHQFLWFLA